MDTSAYLKRQGWRGDGHSLDHTGRGIRKPLLISKKVDVLGVGLNKHAAVSDQWWMRAFDDGLKNLGTGNQSVLASVQKHGIHAGGLYGRFVKGQSLVGTIAQPVHDTETTEAANSSDSSVEIKLSASPNSSPEQSTTDVFVMAGVKRKREEKETAPEKRARRKRERQEKSRENAVADTGPATLREREINKKADTFVNEAIRRGLLPAETRGTHLKNRGMAAHFYGGSVCEAVFKEAGLDASNVPIKGSEKQQKYTRERLKRNLKRAAKTYLSDVIPLTEIEMADIEAKNARKQTVKEEKAAERKRKEAEKELQEEAKKQRRATRLAQKRIMIAEDKAATATTNGQAIPESIGIELITATDNADGFTIGADEVKLDMPVNGQRTKKIPGVGRVDRYPTKAEKRATKMRAMAMEKAAEARNSALNASESDMIDLYRAKQHNMEVAEYRARLVSGAIAVPVVDTSGLSPDKLAGYEKRAAEKGITLEEYIQRRDEKYAAKQGEKLAKESLPPLDAPAASHIHLSRAALIRTQNDKPTANGLVNAESISDQLAAGSLGFVTDTAGDDALMKTSGTGRTKPVDVIDADGNIRYIVRPGEQVPLDPTIWEDIVVKTLPKAVREARRQWMAQRRDERRIAQAAANGVAPSITKKKAKGQRKVETRERFIAKILHASREAVAEGRTDPVQIDDVANVPLVKVATTQGKFSKGEMALGRTVARRVLRNEKRAAREKMGKGKGYKKRERAEKEAARNAGIYGAEKFGWGAQGLPGIKKAEEAAARAAMATSS